MAGKRKLKSESEGVDTTPSTSETSGRTETKQAKPGNRKRKDYLSWDDYFMGIAYVSSERSKDPRTQVGACIVNEDKKIVATGYNGMPIGISDDWDDKQWEREHKQWYVCHAELNAILNRNSADLKNCRIPGNRKRKDYLSWDDYFMGIAYVSSERSKDPRTQVGACIVNEDKKIVATGYNGMPIGISDDWDDKQWEREHKQWYVCHAELNAILNRNSADLKNCRMYVTYFPCNECTKVIIQSGIKEVIFPVHTEKDTEKYKTSRTMMETVVPQPIKLTPYKADRETPLEINFKALEARTYEMTDKDRGHAAEVTVKDQDTA